MYQVHALASSLAVELPPPGASLRLQVTCPITLRTFQYYIIGHVPYCPTQYSHRSCAYYAVCGTGMVYDTTRFTVLIYYIVLRNVQY